jgi:hypothetical protein
MENTTNLLQLIITLISIASLIITSVFAGLRYFLKPIKDDVRNMRQNGMSRKEENEYIFRGLLKLSKMQSHQNEYTDILTQKLIEGKKPNGNLEALRHKIKQEQRNIEEWEESIQDYFIKKGGYNER